MRVNDRAERRVYLRWTAAALAFALLGGIVAATPPPAAEAAASTSEPEDFFPEKSGLTAVPTSTVTNRCVDYLDRLENAVAGAKEFYEGLYKKYNCNVQTVAKYAYPSQLIPERKISDLVYNCDPGPTTRLQTGFSVVQYVENATTQSTSRAHGFTAGVTVTNSWEAGAIFASTKSEISVSASTTNTWSYGTDERKAIQTGHWRNASLDTAMPGYSWAYYGYRDLYQQADLLWQWTPDPDEPQRVESAIQTINIHDWVNDGFSAAGASEKTGREAAFGTPILHIIPMTPAEIKSCWDNGAPAGWKPGDPRLTNVSNGSRLAAPIVDEPAQLSPVGTMALDTYPFLYSTYPLNNPVLRNVAVAQRQPYSAASPASKAELSIKKNAVEMWGRKSSSSSLTKVVTDKSIVMPPGSEVAFWTGNACTTLTATVGGSAVRNPESEMRVKVFSIKMVGGQAQYISELADVPVMSPGTNVGENATGVINANIAGAEAIAIRAYRPDKIAQDMTGIWALSGERDSVVVSQPQISCASASDTPGDLYIRSSYIGEIKTVKANLAATPAQVQADPYLNLRPNATPSEGYPCSERPDYIGYSCAGRAITVNGARYASALGLHSPSTVEWGLTPPTCSAFSFGIGFDDRMAGEASRQKVVVGIYVDNVLQKNVTLMPYADQNPLVKAEQAIAPGPHMIKLVITPENHNGSSHVDIVEPTLTCTVQEPKIGTKPAPEKPVTMDYLPVGGMTWSNETAWHVQALRDKNPSTNGPLQMGGITYPVGIGAHSFSSIDVKVPRKTCSVFMAVVGVLDSARPEGSVVFEVWGGGKRLAQSRVMKAGETPTFLQANIEGLSTVTLKVYDAGDGIGWDHAGWGNPVMACAGTASTEPPPTTDPGPDPVDPEVPPVATEATVSAAAVSWAENSFVYRAATRGLNLDTGKPVTVKGKSFDTAIAAVSGSVVRVTLDGECTKFESTIGVDDYAGRNGSLKFELVGDGIPVKSSPIMFGYGDPSTISANISGVKSLELRITDGGNGIDWDHAVWGNPTLTCATDAAILQPLQPVERYLADMKWSRDEWGTWANQRNQNGMATGKVAIGGVTYDHGIGGHSWSVIAVDLPEGCTTFTTDYGIDDTAGPDGSVRFTVYADGRKLGVSMPAKGTDTVYSMPVFDITGVRQLRLEVDPIEGGDWYSTYFGDHASWGDPRVTCLE